MASYVKSVRAFGASDEVFLESKSAGFASALEKINYSSIIDVLGNY